MVTDRHKTKPPSEITRTIADVAWTASGDDEWTSGDWTLTKRPRGQGRRHTGWYLSDAGGTSTWAASRIVSALKVATLLVTGEWDRTGLAEPDGTGTWRNAATGEVLREPDLLATLEDGRKWRHKNDPLAFRPGVKHGDPDGDREWLMAYAEETGRPYGAILAEALALYRKQVEQAKALLSGGGPALAAAA